MVKIIQIFGPKTIHCYIILDSDAKIIFPQRETLILTFKYKFSRNFVSFFILINFDLKLISLFFGKSLISSDQFLIMTAEEKKKIQAWIPVSIWIKIDQMGFTSQTEAVTQAFKNLISDQNRSKIDQTGSNTDQIRYSEINELSTVLSEKDKRLQEIQEHNETLKIELEKAHQDKAAIQNLYDNYMRQMQTLITQKTIEAPGAKKPWWRFW